MSGNVAPARLTLFSPLLSVIVIPDSVVADVSRISSNCKSRVPVVKSRFGV